MSIFHKSFLITIFMSSCLSQDVNVGKDNTKNFGVQGGKIKFENSDDLAVSKDAYSAGSEKGRKGGSKVNEVNSRQYHGHFSISQPFRFSSSSFHFDDFEFDFPQLIPQTQYSFGGNLKWSWDRPWSSSARKTTRKPVIHWPSESNEGISSSSSNYKKGNGSSTGPRINQSCDCGIVAEDSKKLQRIVGGSVSKENAWPWMVSIAYMGQGSPFWFCGGSLISDKYVLTAAHCLKSIKNFGLQNIKLIMGSSNLLDSSAQRYSVRNVRAHPLYKAGTEDYDFAIIETKEIIKFTNKLSPICLRQENNNYINRTVIVAGWGTLQNGEGPPSDLREVDLKIVSNSVCQKEYYTNYRTPVTSSMICAWLEGKDSCQGDSGGPLFLKTKATEPNAYIQVGVVSFGPPECGVTKIPGVYSRVASAVPWIKSITKNGRFCKGSFE